ncbi:MAG: hypothetical protein IPH57_12510 [Saprospiraceae bacterium]|nr:hypothetical protein [Saprospiraceae bacterium]
MRRLSSNWTLFLKIFLPVFWISFFGGFIIAAFVTNSIEAPQFTSGKFKLQSIIFVLSGVLFFIFTFFRLKRVDGDEGFVYISNYFRTFRYPVDAIEEIIIYDHIIVKAAHIKFKGTTSFGSRIIFLPFMLELKDFCDNKSIILRNYNSK